MEFGAVKRLSQGPAPLAILMVLLALTLFLLHRATAGPEEFGRLAPMLVVISGSELVLFLFLIAGNLARLVRQYRNQATGSRLSARLIVIFVALAVTPVSVVYYFSIDFLDRGIDQWFDVRVDSALKSAIQLSRYALDEKVREQLRDSENFARELVGQAPEQAASMLDSFREQIGAAEVTLLLVSGHIVATSNSNPSALVPHPLQEFVLQYIRRGKSYAALDPTPSEGLQVRVAVSVPYLASSSESHVLQVIAPVVGRVNTHITAVQNGFADYEEMSYMRGPLKISLMLTLSLVLVLTLLGAIWAAFYSARKLVAPIRVLAIGTRLVSSGDYGKQLPLPGNDELGFLVQSFNDMTRKIAQARDAAARSQKNAEGQKAYLEAVLERLSSGVLVLDAALRLRIANAASEHISGAMLTQHIGAEFSELHNLSPLLEHLVDGIGPHFKRAETDWREEVTVFGAGGRQVLLCRGTELIGANEHDHGHVIVFDDISALVQAQRDAAWGEVARRLAHEIKNPLTPIQLSAERLRLKYLKTMEPKDAEVLDRATHTIVQQVEVLKEMVNAFSDYARSPKLDPQPLALNALIDEVIELYRGDHVPIAIDTALDAAEYAIDFDAGRMRQLLHNLIKNAIEAMADTPSPRLHVATRRLSPEEGGGTELSVEDEGPGIPPELIGKIFEPYVTSKPKGSGLGLAIVKKIVEEHGGVITAHNVEHGGARIVVRFPGATPNSLSERHAARGE